MRSALIILSILFIASCGKNETINCTYQLTVYEVPVEDSTATATDNVVGYCFYTDTSQYYVDSYEDALNGKLLGKKGNPEKSFDIEATYDTESESLIFSNITASETMMVVCDTLNKIYSYRNAAMSYYIDTIYVELDVELWQFTDSTYSEITVDKWKQGK